MKFTYPEIYDFIDSMPGGNVPQYSRLTNVGAISLNEFLATTTQGQQLVNSGKVCAPLRGRMPAWATSNTKRGGLTVNNVSPNCAAVIMLKQRLPQQYHADAIYMVGQVIEHARGVSTFSDFIGELTAPFVTSALSNVSLSVEIDRLRLENQQMHELAGLLRENQQLRALTGPLRANEPLAA